MRDIDLARERERESQGGRQAAKNSRVWCEY